MQTGEQSAREEDRVNCHAPVALSCVYAPVMLPAELQAALEPAIAAASLYVSPDGCCAHPQIKKTIIAAIIMFRILSPDNAAMLWIIKSARPLAARLR